jgi:hypothetical protein
MKMCALVIKRCTIPNFTPLFTRSRTAHTQFTLQGIGGSPKCDYPACITALTSWLIIAGLCLVAYLPVLIVLGGILKAYIESAWTITYLRLTAKSNAIKPAFQL